MSLLPRKDQPDPEPAAEEQEPTTSDLLTRAAVAYWNAETNATNSQEIERSKKALIEAAFDYAESVKDEGDSG